MCVQYDEIPILRSALPILEIMRSCEMRRCGMFTPKSMFFILQQSSVWGCIMNEDCCIVLGLY